MYHLYLCCQSKWCPVAAVPDVPEAAVPVHVEPVPALPGQVVPMVAVPDKTVPDVHVHVVPVATSPDVPVPTVPIPAVPVHVVPVEALPAVPIPAVPVLVSPSHRKERLWPRVRRPRRSPGLSRPASVEQLPPAGLSLDHVVQVTTEPSPVVVPRPLQDKSYIFLLLPVSSVLSS